MNEDRKEIRISDLSWFEILSVIAEVSGSLISVHWRPDLSECSIDLKYKVCNIMHSSVCAVSAPTLEEVSKKFLKEMCKWYNSDSTGFGPDHNFIFPKIEFETKEEFELQCILANFDLKFMLRHRGT